jgi:DNA-binding LytR/AlgR family response regulator
MEINDYTVVLTANSIEELMHKISDYAMEERSIMLKIALCDDEELILLGLKKIINECANKNNWQIEVHNYTSGIELIKDINSFDTVFLDMDMPEIDGIETGKIICESNHNCKIIMATGRTDRFKEAFLIHTFRFVSKPFEVNEIEDALQAIMQSRIGQEIIELYENRNLYQISQRDIVYITAYDGYSEFTIQGKKVLRKESSLTELEAWLSHEIFFRVDRKYIVNMLKITSYHDGIIEMQDEKIKVSRRKKKDFEVAYMMADLNYR